MGESYDRAWIDELAEQGAAADPEEYDEPAVQVPHEGPDDRITLSRCEYDGLRAVAEQARDDAAKQQGWDRWRALELAGEVARGGYFVNSDLGELEVAAAMVGMAQRFAAYATTGE